MMSLKRPVVLGLMLCGSVLHMPDAAATMSCVGSLRIDPSAEFPWDMPVSYHQSTDNNRTGVCTAITNTSSNTFPARTLFVTPNRNPNNGMMGGSNPHVLGVDYGGTESTPWWIVLNEDAAQMAPDTFYNVRVPLGQRFTTNSAGKLFLPGIPRTARVSIMPNRAIPGAGAPNPVTSGVRFNTAADQWEVVHLDGSALTAGMGFNVRMEDAIVHTVDAPTQYSPIQDPMALVPGAKVFATPVAPPGGFVSGSNHPVAVTYREGRWHLYFPNPDGSENPLTMPTGARFHVVIESPSSQTTSGSTWNYTSLNDPLSNSNPNATVFVTQSGNGIDNPHPIGVWYNASEQRWSVFNQDYATMPNGVMYNVLVTKGLLHKVSTSNLYYSYINSDLTNYNPQLSLQVTQNWNPGGAGGVYNAANVGTFYDPGEGKWAIYNTNFTALPFNAAFNVAVQSGIVVTNPTSGTNTLKIDSDACNNDPSAKVFATHTYTGGAVDAHAIGVKYSAGTGRWQIYHLDGTELPENASYAVTVN